MPVLESIFKMLGVNVIKDAGDVIDKFVTTDQEREQAKREMTDVLIKGELQAQDQLTERLRIDMNSDSWLAKNIRPLVLIFILLMYSFLSLFDTPGHMMINGQLIATFKVNPSYVELLGQWGMLIMSFYFGSRGIEKVIETMGKYNIGKKKDN